jgi:hypothetical protein
MGSQSPVRLSRTSQMGSCALDQVDMEVTWLNYRWLQWEEVNLSGTLRPDTSQEQLVIKLRHVAMHRTAGVSICAPAGCVSFGTRRSSWMNPLTLKSHECGVFIAQACNIASWHGIDGSIEMDRRALEHRSELGSDRLHGIALDMGTPHSRKHLVSARPDDNQPELADGGQL